MPEHRGAEPGPKPAHADLAQQPLEAGGQAIAKLVVQDQLSLSQVQGFPTDGAARLVSDLHAAFGPAD